MPCSSARASSSRSMLAAARFCRVPCIPVKTSRDRWSARLKMFCTQATCVCATALSNCSRDMLLRPIPSIRPSSRALASAASWASNRLPGASDRSNHAQVHGCQLAGAERDEVVLNALPEFAWLVEARERATGVTARRHLAHDRQLRGIGVQRLADEFVHPARPVELRGINVVHPGVNRRAQHSHRLIPVSRRPVDPVAGELHRAVPGTAHAPGAERERPAKLLPLLPRAVSCRPASRAAIAPAACCSDSDSDSDSGSHSDSVKPSWSLSTTDAPRITCYVLILAGKKVTRRGREYGDLPRLGWRRAWRRRSW